MLPVPAVKQGGHASPPDTTWLIETPADRQAVIDQMERMLASPVFRGSKRLSGFLRYIVQETLNNGGAELKERVIGVHVFGRPADYDTSAEPLVRVSAGDLRKRIAQYYHEPGCENEIRIDLPVGSYHPVFHLPAALTAAVSAAAGNTSSDPVRLPDNEASQPQARITAPEGPIRYVPPRGLWAVGALAALAGISIAVASRMPGDAYMQFWEPVVSEQGPALVYSGGGQADDRIVFEDELALVDLSGELRARNKSFRILKTSEITPATLKQGPSLLIGGFTNQVTRRLTEQLRFAFEREGEPDKDGFAWIQDRQNPERKDWSVTLGPQGSDFIDYAIISRVIDPVTDRVAVVSAGIRKFGTLAAAEFLSHPSQIEALTAGAPRDWRKKNMQAVLAVHVRGGVAGPARVVSSYFW